ncbi:MAG: hypothetical protein FWE82_06840 [Defluviitaleaceae bacterium]|nr:hypothetical protein [Defluviitaleaceae bacterium]
MIQNYNDFLNALLEAGFSGAVGGMDDGVFGLFKYGWTGRSANADDLNQAAVNAEDKTEIQWHTDDPDTDPWQWRIRVLKERGDIAYAKIFFRKAGYITKEWYPYFFAARRGGMTFDEEYSNGTLSRYAKRVYEAVADKGRLTLQDIKRVAGFNREDSPKVESALTELQMKMYLTICEIDYKVSQKGERYGFSYTVFGTAESFWGGDVIKKAGETSPDEAFGKIKDRILLLNPSAEKMKISKFIKGTSINSVSL